VTPQQRNDVGKTLLAHADGLLHINSAVDAIERIVSGPHPAQRGFIGPDSPDSPAFAPLAELKTELRAAGIAVSEGDTLDDIVRSVSGPGEDVTVGTSRASLPSASPVPTPPEIPPYFPVEFAREMTKILAPSDKRNAPASLDDAHAHAIVKRAAVDVLLADQRLCANKAGLLRRYRHLQWFVSCVAAYRPGDAFPPRDDAGGSDDLAVTVRDAVEAFGAEAVASALGLANAERAELIVFRELRNEAVELCAKPEGFRDVHDEANVAYKLTLVGSADAPPAQRCNDNCPYKEALVAGFASIRLTVACEACGQTGLSPSGSNCPKCRGYGDLDENGNPFEDEEDGEDPE
jgi:hypothetical protein